MLVQLVHQRHQQVIIHHQAIIQVHQALAIMVQEKMVVEAVAAEVLVHHLNQPLWIKMGKKGVIVGLGIMGVIFEIIVMGKSE